MVYKDNFFVLRSKCIYFFYIFNYFHPAQKNESLEEKNFSITELEF
jgi:hypothetical protein